MATQFSDVPAWPGKDRASVGDILDATPSRFHNQPPLEERIVMEFDEKLIADGISARIAQIVDSAKRAPDCTSEIVAGQYGDLVKMAGAAVKRVDEAREGLNRPLLTAQRALKGKADGVVADLNGVVLKLRTGLNAFLAEEERKAAAERARIAEQERAAQEAARRVREEQEAAAAEQGKALPEPVYEPLFAAPPMPAAPVARGDLGSRVGTTTVWKHEIISVRQLPDQVLKNAKVVEAIDKVLAAQIRGGAREIKGCRIWDEKVASVR